MAPLIGRILLWAVRSVGALVLFLLVLALADRPSTPPFTDSAGRLLPGSIAEMTTIPIGDIPQAVWFRGASTSNPPLVLLHGGPGTSESALFRAFVPQLEAGFLVVYWDQRGAGRSFSPAIPPQSMTIDRLVADLDELIAYVLQRFGHERVILLAHSWGTVIGLLYAHRHPERVAAYVGIAQVADVPAAERIGWEWALAQAQMRGSDRAIAALTRIGPPPHDVAAMLTSRRWVERFGGSFHGGLSTGALIWAALRTSEVTLWDLVLFGRGNRFSLDHLWPEMRNLRLTGLTTFATPIVFLLGRHDRQVPASVGVAYFETIAAPCKRLVWFERSAHNPPFEEPEAFMEVVSRQVPAWLASPVCARH
ncbi:alpha/beta fold hydrolase [Methylobacterium nodulans]|uniref:Alpha/beta hydrolase fold protein n=1 Tax=Methylobacterium nodulans (strain LMG 21967 / CNCM I-2342 / ORS 2060) TaxID=460265 RepID=B8IGF4_METNO|nr:alpha/beta hydrolase [Methylobacterium nodulans]ACL55854.1 alpha/beta hydrolase fold protein [Methylobacterium nodulans ORS 2060]